MPLKWKLGKTVLKPCLSDPSIIGAEPRLAKAAGDRRPTGVLTMFFDWSQPVEGESWVDLFVLTVA